MSSLDYNIERLADIRRTRKAYGSNYRHLIGCEACQPPSGRTGPTATDLPARPAERCVAADQAGSRQPARPGRALIRAPRRARRPARHGCDGQREPSRCSASGRRRSGSRGCVTREAAQRRS